LTTKLFTSLILRRPSFDSSFFFNDPPTTEIYTLSLHDALPIWAGRFCRSLPWSTYLPGHLSCHKSTPCSIGKRRCRILSGRSTQDRKSTRLNSSHVAISYAVFCLKKKNTRFRDSVCDSYTFWDR